MNLVDNKILSCLNCGQVGHILKKCIEPITSHGIICFNLNKDLKITNDIIKKYFYNKYIDVNEFNYININNINLISLFYDKIKLIMIRRKDSLNYIGFIRGKYNVTNIMQLSKILSLMTKNENIKIKTMNFDKLWKELWHDSSYNNKYKNEYNISKFKFNELKKKKFYNLLDDNNLSKYEESEWGFPKGRRDLNETDIECATREFNEETNLTLNNNDIIILENLNPVEELYKGTNDKYYRHIYYIASVNNEIELTINTVSQDHEISDIRWMTITEALSKIRSYDESKIKLINQIYFFIINLINSITPL